MVTRAQSSGWTSGRRSTPSLTPGRVAELGQAVAAHPGRAGREVAVVDDVARRLEHEAEALVAGAQRLLGLDAVADVDEADDAAELAVEPGRCHRHHDVADAAAGIAHAHFPVLLDRGSGQAGADRRRVGRIDVEAESFDGRADGTLGRMAEQSTPALVDVDQRVRRWRSSRRRSGSHGTPARSAAAIGPGRASPPVARRTRRRGSAPRARCRRGTGAG